MRLDSSSLYGQPVDIDEGKVYLPCGWGTSASSIPARHNRLLSPLVENNHLATFTIMVYGSCCLEAGWVQVGTLGFAQVKVGLTHDLSGTQVNFPQEVNKYIL